MKDVILVLLFACVCFAEHNFDVHWNQWKEKYGKVYSTEHEESTKRATWEKHMEYVGQHNNNVNSEFRLEMNQFADQERPIRNKVTPSYHHTEDIEHNWTDLPSSFDWRTKGAITPVRNQGQMGETLPIVVVECMESYGIIKKGLVMSLSIQEVIDCCTHSSGLLTPVFDCVQKIGGLCSAAAYPMRPSSGSCKNSTCTPVIENQGTKKVPQGREDQLQIAVLQFPVMAAIDASHMSFQMYESGVYDEPKCSSSNLDHVVQIVGYGTQNGKDYWIVKNSWGTSWGMNGYILMSRNKNNQCGIASAASYPV